MAKTIVKFIVSEVLKDIGDVKTKQIDFLSIKLKLTLP